MKYSSGYLGVIGLSLGLVACGGGSDSSPRDVVSDPTYQSPISYEGMTLVWAEEFESDTLDLSSWSYDTGNGCPSLCGWGNNELEYYTDSPENSYVADGKLVIEAKNESIMGAHYSSAKLVTRDKKTFKYGRIDVRAKMPTGQGIWPAIWMLPAENVYGGWPASGEIDITELVGNEPEKIHGTVHYGSSLGYHQSSGDSYSLAAGDFSDDFHVFSVIWAKDTIQWLVDGVTFHSASRATLGTNTYPFNESFYLIMNVAVGGNWPGSPTDETAFPQTMIVDYVRVFQ